MFTPAYELTIVLIYLNFLAGVEGDRDYAISLFDVLCDTVHQRLVEVEHHQLLFYHTYYCFKVLLLVLPASGGSRFFSTMYAGTGFSFCIRHIDSKVFTMWSLSAIFHAR